MINPLFLQMRWIQTIPTALLAFAAFREEQLRWSRGRSCAFSTVYMFLCSIAMALLSPLSSQNGQRNIIARDLSLAAFLCVYAFWWLCSVRAPAAHKGLVAGILLHYWMGLQTVGDVFAALILRESYAAQVSAEGGSMTYNLCVLAATVMTWPLVYFFLHQILRKNLGRLGSREIGHGIAYLFVVFLLFSAATYNPHFESIPDTPLFVMALLVTDMITYYIFFQEISTVRRLADYELQYQLIVSRMENVKRLRHDMRHHLNVISAFNAQGRQDAIAAYLQQYGKVCEQLEQGSFFDDPAADSVLGYYLALAAEEGVAMECQAVQPLGKNCVEHMDMTVLLGNCLENAMEAVRSLPAENRRITVELQPMGAMLLLRIVNTCAPGLETDGFVCWKAFPSGKRIGRTGVGLRSVSEIAEKYSGSASFCRKNGEFIAQVSLCGLPEQP